MDGIDWSAVQSFIWGITGKMTFAIQELQPFYTGYLHFRGPKNIWKNKTKTKSYINLLKSVTVLGLNIVLFDTAYS